MSRRRASRAASAPGGLRFGDVLGIVVALAALLLGGAVLLLPGEPGGGAPRGVRLEGGLSESALDERVRLRIARTPPARPRAAWAPERLSARWRYITVHHSATLGGNARRFDRYHRTERHLENGLPYHFVIGNGNGSADGFVEVGPRWTDQLDGGHVRGGELNRVAIGICLVGNFETHLPSERQIASLKALLNFLLETTGVEEADVLGHRGMPGQTTLCPGRFLPAELVVETRTSPPGPAEGAGAQ